MQALARKLEQSVRMIEHEVNKLNSQVKQQNDQIMLTVEGVTQQYIEYRINQINKRVEDDHQKSVQEKKMKRENASGIFGGPGAQSMDEDALKSRKSAMIKLPAPPRGNQFKENSSFTNTSLETN